jgi:drug/metabolite transporter (DMT)-like permease
MKTHSGEWQMVIAMALSGTIGLFVLASGQSVPTVIFFRCLIGSLTLLGWLRWRRGWVPLSWRALGWLLLGAGALLLNWYCLFSAYRRSSISVATVVYHVQPFFLVLLAALAQKEIPSKRKLLWLFMAFVGVAMSSGIDVGGGASAMFAGAALACTAAFLYALATLATRKLNGIPPAQIAGIQLLIGVAVLAPLTDIPGAGTPLASLLSLGALGLIHTGLLYQLMYSAFQKLPACRIAILSFIYPLMAILVDMAWFGTRLTPMQCLGMLFILLAVIANQRDWQMPALRAPRRGRHVP